MPHEKIDSSWKTVSTTIETPYAFREDNVNADDLVNNYKFIQGYDKAQTGGDLIVRLAHSGIDIKKVEIKTRTQTTKDKAGKETTTNYYNYSMVYFYKASAELTTKDGTVLKKVTEGGRDMASYGTEYKTYREAYDSYHNHASQIRYQLALSELNNLYKSAARAFDHSHGFPKSTATYALWEIGSKKHPEYAAFQEKINHTIETMKAISAVGPIDTTAQAFAEDIAYYKSLADKYKSDEKGDQKIRYAAYNNLPYIYYAVENFEKPQEYATLLVKNEYDKKDGEEILTYIENTKSTMALNGFSTRYFDRLKNL